MKGNYRLHQISMNNMSTNSYQLGTSTAPIGECSRDIARLRGYQASGNRSQPEGLTRNHWGLQKFQQKTECQSEQEYYMRALIKMPGMGRLALIATRLKSINCASSVRAFKQCLSLKQVMKIDQIPDIKWLEMRGQAEMQRFSDELEQFT